MTEVTPFLRKTQYYFLMPQTICSDAFWILYQIYFSSFVQSTFSMSLIHVSSPVVS